MHRVENIADKKPKPVSRPAVPQGPVRNRMRWPKALLIVSLVVLSIMAAVFASQSEEPHRLITSYISPMTSLNFSDKPGITQIRKIYHYFSPVDPSSIEQSSALEREADFERFHQSVASIQKRLSTLEANIEALSSERPQSVLDDNDVVKDINNLRILYATLVKKLDGLPAHDVDTATHDTMARLAKDVQALDQTASDIGSEQGEWLNRLQAMTAATEHTRVELGDIRNRMEALAKADCSSCAPSPNNQDSVSVAEINDRITAAIAKYDADKTGMADFALESGGGSIVGVRCTETFYGSSRQETLFGFPIWYKEYSPRTVIQPGFAPGECWAFKGSHGYLTIKLSGLIEVTGVSYEHISKTVSPTGNIDSAPSVFEVYALADAKDEEGLRLGKFKYDSDGPALQYFEVQVENAPATNYVELRVLSNYGHPVYTCLYRFRVHGRRVEPAYGGKDKY